MFFHTADAKGLTDNPCRTRNRSPRSPRTPGLEPGASARCWAQSPSPKSRTGAAWSWRRQAEGSALAPLREAAVGRGRAAPNTRTPGPPQPPAGPPRRWGHPGPASVSAAASRQRPLPAGLETGPAPAAWWRSCPQRPLRPRRRGVRAGGGGGRAQAAGAGPCGPARGARRFARAHTLHGAHPAPASLPRCTEQLPLPRRGERCRPCPAHTHAHVGTHAPRPPLPRAAPAEEQSSSSRRYRYSLTEVSFLYFSYVLLASLKHERLNYECLTPEECVPIALGTLFPAWDITWSLEIAAVPAASIHRCSLPIS